MKTNTNNGILFNMVKVLLAISLICGLALPAMAVEENPMTKADYEYGWTDENPKPFWWRWDDVYNKEKPVRGGIRRYATNREPGLFNPNHWPVTDWQIMSGIYSSLIYSDGQWKPNVPWLARSWKYENDLTVIMELRKGVRFTDGTDFNAHNVKYQTDWILDRKNGAWSRNWLRPLKSVEVVNDYTVRWHLKEPWSAFFDVISSVPGWPISMKALKADVAIKNVERLKGKIKLGEKKVRKAEAKANKASRAKAKKLAKKLKKARKKLAQLKKDMAEAQKFSAGAKPLDEWAVGSGRWILDEVRPGNYTKLKRNPDWWFGKAIGQPDMPYYDGYITTVIPEKSIQMANLKAGKIDSLEVDKSQYAQVKDDPDLRVWITPVNMVAFGGFNQKGVFRDIRLRKAVSHAIDRKALIAADQHGFARVATCSMPDGHYAHNPNLKPVKYDPELSRKLIKEAGYPNGLTVKGILWADGGSRRHGEIIRIMLKRVGINWEVDYLEPVAFDDRMRNLEYDLSTFTVPVIDPYSQFVNIYVNEKNNEKARLWNEKINAMVKTAGRELDFEKRKKLYWDVEKALYDNYEDAWLFYGMSLSATRKEVRGYNREFWKAAKNAYFPTHPQWFKDGKRD